MTTEANSKMPILSVEKIMVFEIHSISPEMTVRESILKLLKNRIHGAPVIDSQKKVMSVVSQGDLLKLAATMGLDKTIFQCMTKLVKTDELITVKKKDSFTDAYKKFLSHSVHRLIVVDDHGRLEGMLSRSNILEVIATPSK